MSVKIFSSELKGALSAPPAKSHAIRLIAGAAMADGITCLKNCGTSDDVQAALRLVKQHFGQVFTDDECIHIVGNKPTKNSELHCGESGLNARLFPVLKAITNTQFSVNGSGSLLTRPIALDLLQLQKMGVNIQPPQADGLPVQIQGGVLTPGEYLVQGSRSSQFVTGLLMALPLLGADSSLKVHHISSLPYIHLTIHTLKSFGITVEYLAPDRFFIQGKQKYRSGSYRAEGDWSSAAFLFAAGALLGHVEIAGLHPASEQADRNILEIMHMAGADCRYSNGMYTVKKSKLKAFEFDFMHSPDLFPVALLLAAHAQGTSKLTGIEKLRIKESNRIEALCNELSKSGVKPFCGNNELVVTGGNTYNFAEFNTYNDHRIAMVLALHAMTCNDGGVLDQSACVTKSYPEFFNDLQRLGGNIHE